MFTKKSEIIKRQKEEEAKLLKIFTEEINEKIKKFDFSKSESLIVSAPIKMKIETVEEIVKNLLSNGFSARKKYFTEGGREGGASYWQIYIS